MAESAVSFLLEKLSQFLEEEWKLLGGVKEDVRFIRDELESMTAFSRVSDAMEDPDPELQAWVRQVREVAYEIEDTLDEFMVGMARCDLRRGFFHKMGNPIKRLKARHQVAAEIQNIKARVSGVAERHRRYGFNSEQGLSQHAAASTEVRDRRGDALLLDEAELVGIDKPKRQLMDWLLDTDPQFKVHSVWGMGGLGKTTLVKKVYDDKKVKKHFECHVWITVSESFNSRELLKKFIKQLYDEIRRPVPSMNENMNNDELRSLIKEFLQQRRYVIVLDDVWQMEAWSAINHAFPKGVYGSRVLLTTRNSDVAHSCSYDIQGNVYEMKALSQNESWSLFCKKVFHGENCPSHLKEVSASMLRKCGGLPLAVVAIAGVLVSKSRNEWASVNRSLGSEVDKSDKLKSMKRILLLSYNELPYHLRSCLLYLSCFPEDYEIWWGRIKRLWIAEGFVEEKEGKTLEEVAEAYLYELLNRSLLQVAVMGRDGRPFSFRIHDLLREIILSKSSEENFLMVAAGEGTGRWPEKIRRLSIHNTLQNIPQGKYVRYLCSLLLFRVVDDVSKSTIPFLFHGGGGLKLLKVLELRGSSLRTFPDEVVSVLLNLRYLSLAETQVEMLPKSIWKLQNLQTLDLVNTKVTRLPVEILRLKQLRHLTVYSFEPFEPYITFHDGRGFEAPSKIGELQSLQTLWTVEVDDIILKEIGKLTQLRDLRLVKLRREDGEVMCSSIDKLVNLRGLQVISREEDEILDLQSVSQAPRFLESLSLTGPLEKLPHWITGLRYLVTLELRWSKLWNDPLRFLENLPNLVGLSLVQAYQGEEMCFKAGKFQRLKKVWLERFSGLKWVRVEEGAMPSLETLLILNCKLVEELPDGIQHLSNFQRLELVDMSDRLIEKLNPEIQDGDFTKIQHIPNVFIRNF